MVEKDPIHESGAGDQVNAPPSVQETLKDRIEHVLNTLKYREREMIKLLYGLDGLGGGYIYTRKQVGTIFKVSEDRVRQITARAFRKLQHPIRSQQLEEFLGNLTPEDDLFSPEGRLLKKIFGRSHACWPPNFFDFATSERCQDAFISWLIAWAEDNQREANEPLHRTGIFFLGRLLGLHGIEPPQRYTHLGIQKYKCIDILVTVNRDFVVLIEDKINFSEIPGQLERYLNTVQQDFHQTPVPIFLKTGYQPDDYAAIEQVGWKCFLRRNLVEVLEYGKQQGVDNEIFSAFHSRMKRIEAVARRRRAQGFYHGLSDQTSVTPPEAGG